MSIKSVGAAVPNENTKNLYTVQHKLDAETAKSFQNRRSSNLDIDSEGVNVDLSNITTQEAKAEPATESIKLPGDADNNSTKDFEDLIQKMKGLSDSQKTTLQNAINAAADTLSNSQSNSVTYGMRIAQTNLEFKYISQNMVGKEYQEKFNAIAEDYTKKQSDSFVNFETYFAEDLTNRTDDLSTKMGWQKEGKEWLNSIEKGTDQYQTSRNNFQSLYNNIDVSSKDTMKDQVDNVYKNVLKNAGTKEQDLSIEIKYLSEKWNGVMDALGEKKNKFTTSVNCLV